MHKLILYPKPVRVEIIKSKITIVKDRVVIIKPLYYN